MAKYTLKFSDKSFNASNVEGISKTWQNYTPSVKQTNDMMKPLDRYDDFATMKIQVTEYQSKGGKYGIPYNPTVHRESGKVITDHQRGAAQAFLQKLRGFGLLADVVGSGKTFEACTVLSEMAARGAIDSMLLIVPRQVLGEWVNVLENKFALGEGMLYRYPELNKKDENGVIIPVELPKWEDIMYLKDGVYRPKRPIIVAMEDFLLWDNAMNECLYDVVVVDEAHHLCDRNDDDYAGAMYRLSLLMQVKKRFNKSYCLLLSATPHSGDLEKMFRLWYFIRCKGGDPKDFKDDDKNLDDATGRHTARYERELARYRNEICRGAKTVFDFINKVKIGEITADNSPHKDKFMEFYREKYPEKSNEKTAPEFSSITEMQKIDFINDFLKENKEIRDVVIKNVANAYHNGVLRSIMIRSPKSASTRLGGRTKNSKNIFFFPLKNGVKTVDVEMNGDKIKVDVTKMGDIYGRFLTVEGTPMSLSEYAKDVHNGNESGTKANLMSKILHNKLGVDDATFKFGKFERHGAWNFYSTQMNGLKKEIENIYVPLADFNTDAVFNAKMGYLKTILKTHPTSRILIFFDYDLRAKDRVTDKVEQALKADSEFSDRLLCATKRNKLSINKEFDEKEGAILLAKDASVTEGTNLQSSNIVINFQVTPDPVAMEQRIGRVFRLGQRNNVTIYSLADMTSLEGYVLAYFSKIGLLSSDSGDATIIAGSNNNNMITIRCKKCENAMLLSREEYDRLVAQDHHRLYCTKTHTCKDPATAPRGTLMTEISTTDFQCSNSDCGVVFERSAAGYECMAADKGVMCNTAGNRNYYCNKMCAISHCRMFMPGGPYENCAALKYYRQHGAGADTIEMLERCEMCENKCPEQCRCSYGLLSDNPEKSVAGCTGCPESSCYPTPGVLRFDENWEANCPVCNGRGKLRPIVSRTFPTYIRSLWNYEFDDKAFCTNLMNEANRVGDIGNILETDDSNE